MNNELDSKYQICLPPPIKPEAFLTTQKLKRSEF